LKIPTFVELPEIECIALFGKHPRQPYDKLNGEDKPGYLCRKFRFSNPNRNMDDLPLRKHIWLEWTLAEKPTLTHFLDIGIFDDST
jgi:hypothetical protein